MGGREERKGTFLKMEIMPLGGGCHPDFAFPVASPGDSLPVTRPEGFCSGLIPFGVRNPLWKPKPATHNPIPVTDFPPGLLENLVQKEYVVCLLSCLPSFTPWTCEAHPCDCIRSSLFSVVQQYFLV